jgi:hypothetical protein
MRNPFAVTVAEKISYLSIKAKEPLMELSCDISLKIKFEALSLPEFRIYIKIEHLELSQATEVLLLFGTTYLCQKHFQQWQQLNRSTVTAFSLKVTYDLL